MYPLAYAHAQRTIRVWAVVGIIVCAALIVGFGTSVFAGRGSATARFAYNVTYEVLNESAQGASGSAPYLTMISEKISLNGSNMVNVSFHISWADQSISPFTDPTVTGTVTGPNGTGTTTNRVQSSGSDLVVVVPNEVPANQTVEAGSDAEAVAIATGQNANATLGSGTWTVSLDVGAPLGGRVRPGGSVTFTITVEIEYFVASAKRM